MASLAVKDYMVPVYAVLIKNGRDINSLPEEYIIPVAEYVAAAFEGAIVTNE